MTPDDLEAIYDDQIAPLLMQAAKLAEENGISLVAKTEWGDRSGTTKTLSHPSVAMRILELVTRTGDNVDGLFMALMRYGRERGHSSIYLSMLENMVGPGPEGPSLGDEGKEKEVEPCTPITK